MAKIQKAIDSANYAENFSPLLRFIWINLAPARFDNEANFKDFEQSVRNSHPFRLLRSQILDPEKVEVDLFNQPERSFHHPNIPKISTV